MKKLILLIVLFVSCTAMSQEQKGFGRNLIYETSPLMEDAIKKKYEAAVIARKRALQTEAYLDQILKNILDLRMKTNDNRFDKYLKKWHEYFNSFHEYDLSNFNVISKIKESERELSVQILEYNKRVKRNAQEEKDDAISPYYTSMGSKFYKKPNTNSGRFAYPDFRELIAVVEESRENRNFFLVKTKNNEYGYLPKDSFEDIVVEKYSSSEFLRKENKDRKKDNEDQWKYAKGKFNFDSGAILQVKDDVPLYKKPYASADKLLMLSKNQKVKFIRVAKKNPFFAEVEYKEKKYFIHHGSVANVLKQ